MREFYRYLKILQKQQKEYYVRAMIIQVWGSSYRHEGAVMFFGKDGKNYGTLSGGCLEGDLSHHAEEVMYTKNLKIVEYDLSSENDLLWGIGAGCDGKIRILLEPFDINYIPPNHGYPILPRIEQILDNGKKVYTARSIDGKVKPGTILICSDNNMETGQIENAELQRRLSEYLKQFISSGASFQYTFLTDLESHFIFEMLEPKDALYIFGAGPDVEPVVKYASNFDFLLTVIDPRGNRCNRNFFSSADYLINEHPEVFLNKNKLRDNSFVLIMTHNFSHDKQILELLVKQPPPDYIGILGSRSRAERLLPPKQLIHKIYCPVGLDIGAEGPEEISISVMAQLIQVRKRRYKISIGEH